MMTAAIINLNLYVEIFDRTNTPKKITKRQSDILGYDFLSFPNIMQTPKNCPNVSLFCIIINELFSTRRFEDPGPSNDVTIEFQLDNDAVSLDIRVFLIHAQL